MKITVITVGKIKESYYKKSIQDLSVQLNKHCNFIMFEVPDEKAPENLSDALMEQVKKLEGEKILRLFTDDMYVVTLEIMGNEITSEKLSKKFTQIKNAGKDHICFVIGGSLGLSNEVSKRSNYKLSFSKMTFPHQLMRVILLDQLVHQMATGGTK